MSTDTAAYFVKVFCVLAMLETIMNYVVIHALGASKIQIPFVGFWDGFSLVVISPIVETFILAYCVIVASQPISNASLASIFAAAPMIGLHAIPEWQHALVATPAMIGYAYVLGVIRQCASAWTAITFVAVMHMVWNASILGLHNFT